MDRMLESFFSFKPDRNWLCRAHDGDHYQDRVYVEREVFTAHPVAEWLLHDNTIASLERTSERRLRLYLSDAGYPTPTTVRRLNAILAKLREIAPNSPRIECKLKYSGPLLSRTQPVFTYFDIGGKAYLSDLTINVKLDEGAAEPLIAPCTPLLLFKDYSELKWLQRLHREVGRGREAVEEVLNALEDLGAFSSGCPAGWLRERAEEARRRAAQLDYQFRNLKQWAGLTEFGVRDGIDFTLLREELKRLRAAYGELAEEVKQVLAEAKLVL